MGATEIVLLVIGIIAFVLSFIIPAKREKLSKESLKEAKEEIQKIVDAAVKEANSNIEDNVTEVCDYNVEKSERAMERLCNEKIMAINEYASTVLESIDKNHQEVMFLYDMLNEKHNTLKETAATVDKTIKEAKKQKVKVQAEEAVVAETVEEVAKEEKMVSLEKAEEVLKEIPAANEEKADDIVKQLDVIKNSKNKKSTTCKKTSKVKENEAPDLNIGTISSKKDGGRNSNERILQLHNEGKSNVAIAKELGLGIGEVKLVIDLFEGM